MIGDDERKITIIEGPPPIFVIETMAWSRSVLDRTLNKEIFIAWTEMRSMSASDLVIRCKEAWSAGDSITLEFKDNGGLIHETNIIAAKAIPNSFPDAYIGKDSLRVWVQFEKDKIAS